jgi:LysM repeat protein
LAALVALVLGVHFWLLLSSGVGIWRLQPESQKLGPLQTRVLSSGVSQTTPTSPSTEKTRQVAPAKPKAPESTSTPSSAGISAVASSVLPAPEDSPVLPKSEQPSEALPNLSQQAPPTEEVAPLPPETVAVASAPLPPPSNALTAKPGDFPPNIQINYKLTGQERGLTYHASGSLKWQTQATPNAPSPTPAPKAYEAELRVRAFLVGSRVWRSTGILTENGLSPVRYSDSGRGERAAHFDTTQNKISFSVNTPGVALQPGAQDQVSLFIQMAATVAAKNFKLGSELNVQTATARDAVNWVLTFKSEELIEVDGKQLATQRWVCLPRGKFDSQIEMWLSQSHGGLPVRIKITQVTGNFIDMEMRDSETLPALPS